MIYRVILDLKDKNEMDSKDLEEFRRYTRYLYNKFCVKKQFEDVVQDYILAIISCKKVFVEEYVFRQLNQVFFDSILRGKDDTQIG